MILLDYKDRRPLYEQVVERFQELMIRSILVPDSPMPSVRNLAMELSINPNTIQRAYAELERQEFIYTIKGKGSFVSNTGAAKTVKQKEVMLDLKSLVEKARMVDISEDVFTGAVVKLYEKRGKCND